MIDRLCAWRSQQNISENLVYYIQYIFCRGVFSHCKQSLKENKTRIPYLGVQLHITFTSCASAVLVQQCQCNTLKSQAGFVVTKRTNISGSLEKQHLRPQICASCLCARLPALLRSRFGSGNRAARCRSFILQTSGPLLLPGASCIYCCISNLW